MAAQPNDVTEKFVSYLKERERNQLGRFVQERSPDYRSVVVDWSDLWTWDSDLAEDILDSPKRMRPIADEGLRIALKDLPVADEPEKHGPIHLRFKNLQRTRGTDETRSRHIGDFFEVSGQVSKVSQIKPSIKKAVFECLRCGSENAVPATGGDDLPEPGDCVGCERSGPYQLLTDASDWIDTQLVRVQQPAEETLGGQGAYLDVHLADDAVVPLKNGKFKPGNRVSVSGRYTVDTSGKTPEEQFSGDVVRVEETDYSEIDISAEEAEQIEAIANGQHGDPFGLLVDSVAPSHHGDEHIKLALTLQMFRGVRAQRPDGSWTRGDSHMLLLGDPGVGKSSLLRRVSDIAPRSTYASGKGASAAGMTAAAVPSDFGDEKWDVQAGVLVLSSGGLACVDEIDKVQEDAVSSMHDALEAPQVVEVDKADIHTTLPAQTSLLAAGNPKHGRFTMHEDVVDQIDISPTLLSRFDLMFLMEDRPDEDKDRMLADTMITSRRDAVRGKARDEPAEGETAPPIDENLLRKYIAYARQNYYPEIRDDEVADTLANTFIKLREQGYDPNSPVPVTPRKLEALGRLVEASARIRCSKTVEEQDISRVAQLLFRSLTELGMNEDGDLDADVIEVGAGKPQQDRMKAIPETVNDMLADYEDGVPRSDLLDSLERDGFNREKVGHAIEKLKSKGELYEPEREKYRTT